MKVVITGASGMIGKLLSQMLLAEGNELIIFTTSPEATRNILPGAREYVKWTTEDKDGFETHIEWSEAVIHLAGTSIFGALWDEDYREQILSTRENGTRNLVNAIKRVQNKPNIFLSASAIGIYGFSDENSFTEENEPGEGFLAEVSKRWEKEASEVLSEKIRLVKVRVGVVLDPNEGALGKILTPFKYFMGGSIGDGNQWTSWIHSLDAARVFIEALNNYKYEGAINAVAPNPVRMKEFASILGEILNRPALLKIPKLPLKVVLEDASIPVTEGIKVLPKKLMEYNFKFEFENIREALNNLVKSNL